MLYRLTFRRTDDNSLHISAHPDKGAKNQHLLVAIYHDPTGFATALGLAGVSTATESELAVAAGKAWESRHIDVCCEAAELMDGQLVTLGLHQPSDKSDQLR